MPVPALGKDASACPAPGSSTPGSKKYTLLGAGPRRYLSATPGQLGGHRKNKIYGQLDCPTALRAIAGGGYVTSRVFFADERTAITVGYRPCAACMPAAFKAWKALSQDMSQDAAAVPRVSVPQPVQRGVTGG